MRSLTKKTIIASIFLSFITACSIKSSDKNLETYTFSPSEIEAIYQKLTNVCEICDPTIEIPDDSYIPTKRAEACRSKSEQEQYDSISKIFPLLKFKPLKEKCYDSADTIAVPTCEPLQDHNDIHNIYSFCNKYNDSRHYISTKFIATGLVAETFDAKKEIAMLFLTGNKGNFPHNYTEWKENILKTDWGENNDKIKKLDFLPSIKILSDNLMQLKVLHHNTQSDKLYYTITNIYTDTNNILEIWVKEEIVADMQRQNYDY